jgi:SAM-dependent methyltransferase
MQPSDLSSNNLYTQEFFNEIQESSRRSAEVIVPLILEILAVDRVVDVGCGDGTWLKVFQQHGVKEILGIDGNYVDENILVISKDRFMDFDLTKPVKIPQLFDLVISLEVAEHLAAEYAETFIDSLTNLGSVILFSAAIPCQEGIDHINLQWQEFWANLFQERGYVAFDCIRKNIWSDNNVAYYYRQNMLLFAHKDYVDKYSLETKLGHDRVKDTSLVSVVHPIAYLYMNEELQNVKKSHEIISAANTSLKSILKSLPQATMLAISRRLKKITG